MENLCENNMRKIRCETTTLGLSVEQVDVEEKSKTEHDMYFICSRWRNKPANKVWWNRTKHPKRWDSMPHWYFCLPIVDFDSPMWYIACVLLSMRWSNICCSWYAWFIVTISTWLLLLCCWYMSTPHHIFLYVSCWQTIPYCRWVTFTIHKLLVETLMYMQGSRHVVILLVKLCEGSPPKNTHDIVDEIVWGESPQDHLWYLLVMVTMWKEMYACFMSNS